MSEEQDKKDSKSGRKIENQMNSQQIERINQMFIAEYQLNQINQL